MWVTGMASLYPMGALVEIGGAIPEDCKMSSSSDSASPTAGDRRHLPPAHSFLPPETVNLLLQYGSDFPMDLAIPETMCIVFSDMRGFTEMAENHDPKDVYAAINASLAVQTRLVLAHGGSVNKFLGDGLLACFSGQDRVARAVRCVLEMSEELQRREEEEKHLPCPVGFGVNDGKILLGILGSRERREFTVLGDVVNTAARLCGIAAPFQALITEAAVRGLPEEMARAHCRFFQDVHFKGKFEPTRVYSLAS